MSQKRCAARILLFVYLIVAAACARLPDAPSFTGDAFDIRTAGSGAWSDPQTWQPQRRPGQGDRVLIRSGHRVTYDAKSDDVIRTIAVAGTLTFARDRDTELDVGVVTVFGAEDPASATGVGVADVHDHRHHGLAPGSGGALEVGTADEPIPAPYTSRIRLHYLKGMNRDDAPAVICRPGGRMDFHGAPLKRTWLKLGRSVSPGDRRVALVDVPSGWRIGDEVALTGSIRNAVYENGHAAQRGTETRRIAAIDGNTLLLDAPAAAVHYGAGSYRSEVANLSRTVIVESATPEGVRGHTMYHRYSRGSISYARFAHLGKEATLGRYPIHFHRVGDTMRGSSVIGAAIVDSRNRWITVHGTEYLVVRDCIGFGSTGHGFFLEDGTEVYNVLDRNLGIQAHRGQKMKNQALPYDLNEGAAFWWANGRNTLVRNVACENDHYGFRYEIRGGGFFDSRLPIRQPDGSRAVVDLRNVPIYRFQDDESHTEELYSFSMTATDFREYGDPPARTRLERDPEAIRHPNFLENLSAWQTNYGLHVELPTTWVENVDLDHAVYGVYRPWFENQVYENLRISHSLEPFNRGFDDDSIQHGRITVDGLRVEGRSEVAFAVIQISDQNLSGTAESHFRNVTVLENEGAPSYIAPKPLVDRGGGRRPTPTTAHGVPVYLHDFFGPGRTAKVVSTAARDFGADGLAYREEKPITGDESRLAEVDDVEFPQLLDPRDDQPPATVVTWPVAGDSIRADGGRLTVVGTTTDNDRTRRVVVNGVAAEDADYNFHQWKATLSGVPPGPLTITARAEDEAGNVEQTPHVLRVDVR